MIKLKKQVCPAILDQNKNNWTDEVMEYVNRGEKPPTNIVGRYRHSDIKNAVSEDSHDKCIYCESKISHAYFGDIEHLKPKDNYPEQTFEWENLGFVCSQCNNSKLNHYDETLPPINPFVEDPSDFLIALGELIFGICGNGRGHITEKLLKLNRPSLIERRRERIQMIKSLADNYINETNTLLKELILKEIKEELVEDKQFSMCCREFIKAYMNISL